MTNNLYEMKLHDILDFDEYNIIRVPGGWIYRFWDIVKGEYGKGTFVPLYDEFMEMTEETFQREQVKKLHSQENSAYEKASIYTILFDLVEGNGLDEVFLTLHNLATDLEQRKELEDKFKEAKKWSWPKMYHSK
ncbi:MAG: hypothetical protein WDK95_16440 [Syntrophorhabdaceae bacterium]